MAFKSKHTDKQKAEAVRRYLEAGESAAKIARDFKVSKPGFYIWLRAAKQEAIRQAANAPPQARGSGMMANAELRERQVLIDQNKELQREVHKLRDKLVALMVKHGEI